MHWPSCALTLLLQGFVLRHTESNHGPPGRPSTGWLSLLALLPVSMAALTSLPQARTAGCSSSFLWSSHARGPIVIHSLLLEVPLTSSPLAFMSRAPLFVVGHSTQSGGWRQFRHWLCTRSHRCCCADAQAFSVLAAAAVDHRLTVAVQNQAQAQRLHDLSCQLGSVRVASWAGSADGCSGQDFH